MPSSHRFRIAAAIATAILSVPLSLSGQAPARTITVRLLNGKTGRPIAKQQVELTILNGGERSKDISVWIREDGTGTAEIPVGVESVEIQHLQGDYFADCNSFREQIWSEPLLVENVLKNGYVAGNVCGTRKVVARAGEIVVWGDLGSWFRRLFPVC